MKIPLLRTAKINETKIPIFIFNNLYIERLKENLAILLKNINEKKR